MYRLKRFRAFSLSEVLVAMSLIGILAITMLSLNNFSDNNYKIAATRLMQIDNALQVWGKAVTKNEITGLSTITDQESLRSELQNNIVSIYPANRLNNIETSEGLLQGGEKLTLNDDSTIEFVALTEGNAQAFKLKGYVKNIYDSPVALLKVTVPIKNTTKTLTEEYVLTNSELKYLAETYEGWEKVESQTVNGENVYCIDEELCGKDVCKDEVCGCALDSTYCVDKPVYIGPKENEYCDGNGKITKTQIGTILGTEEKIINTCCPKPKYYAGTNDDGSIKCTCQDKTIIDKGYGFNAYSATCQSLCLKGTYSKDGECIACEPGEYCPNDGMDKPEACPQGFYCPNKEMTTPINCPKGSYCPNTKMTTPITCLKGSYCPNENMIGYILCDIGHYCPDDGMDTTLKCPVNSYCPNDLTKIKNDNYHDGKYVIKDNKVEEVKDGGLINSKKCSENSYSAEGSSYCQTCPAGTYMKINYKKKKGKITTEELNRVCEPCPRGHYCPDPGMTKPLGCPAGYYQNKQGQTSCTICPCGKYSDKKGSTSCKKVKAGYYWPNEVGKNSPASALTSPEGIKCYGDKFATAKQYCPAGRCSQKPSCPEYGDIYMITDGHGDNISLDDLLDNFSCLSKDGFTKDELAISGAQKIFIINKQYGKFNLIASGTLATKVNTLRKSEDYNKVFGEYSYSAKGASYGNYTCPGAHTTSAIGGTLRVEQNDMYCTYNVSLLGKRVSPLVLDLDGDGMDFTSLEDGVYFDLNADGEIENTAWTYPQTTFDDAFLCLDRNNNNLIDDGKELFGDQHGADNGFEELKGFDLNNDKVIDKNDEVYSKLLLWVDFNKNGVVDYIPEEDYEILVKQAKNLYGQIDLKDNMDCNENTCKYYILEKSTKYENKSLGPLHFQKCNTDTHKKLLKPTNDTNGKTIELQTLEETNIPKISLDYSIERDAAGNLLTDGNGNTVGMLGTFTKYIKIGADKVADFLDEFTDRIVQIGEEFFLSVTHTLIDVWFVTDNE